MQSRASKKKQVEHDGDPTNRDNMAMGENAHAVSIKFCVGY
jgi:hypothetical protein